MVHLQLDPSIDQATRDLLQYDRLRAACAELDGSGPVAGACEYRLGCRLLEKDELRLDSDEERDPCPVLRVPGCTKLASALLFSSGYEAKTRNRGKVQDLSTKSTIGRWHLRKLR